MYKRYNGKSFTFELGGVQIAAKKFSLDITDNSTAAKRRGRLDGYLVGDVEANGTITLDRDGLRAVIEAARNAGSFQDMECFDLCAYAYAGNDDSLLVEAFGCKLKMSKVLDVDRNSADETEFEISYDVTSPDFVNIDGVPYATVAEQGI